MEPKNNVFATLSETKILKDLSNEITTFLVRDPPKTDSKSKPKTALQKNAPKSHPSCENCFILDSHWAPQEGTNFSRRHQKCERGILWGPNGSQMVTQTLQKPILAPTFNTTFNKFLMIWGCNLSHLDNPSCKDTGSV